MELASGCAEGEEKAMYPKLSWSRIKTYGFPIVLAVLIAVITLEAGAFLAYRSFPVQKIQDEYDLAQEAYNFYQMHRYADSVDFFERASKEKSSSEEIWFDLGNAYYQQGQFDQACEAYRKALELKPGDEDALVNFQLATKHGIEVLKWGKKTAFKEEVLPPPGQTKRGFWKSLFQKMNDFLRQ